MLIFLFSILTIWGNIDYAQVFGEDYQKALLFCQKNEVAITQKATLYHLPKTELTSIIFPELIRHSSFQDFFETKALELAYVHQGKELADFSIGHFQMKPSFVEKLELMITSNSSLSNQFPSIIDYPTKELSEQRKIRLQRLQNLDWQLDYLCCFYVLTNEKFATELKELSVEERLKFLATAYNCGFDKSWETIQKWSSKACYPYGIKYPESQQYVYAEVAWDYYYNNRS